MELALLAGWTILNTNAAIEIEMSANASRVPPAGTGSTPLLYMDDDPEGLRINSRMLSSEIEEQKKCY